MRMSIKNLHFLCSFVFKGRFRGGLWEFIGGLKAPKITNFCGSCPIDLIFDGLNFGLIDGLND